MVEVWFISEETITCIIGVHLLLIVIVNLAIIRDKSRDRSDTKIRRTIEDNIYPYIYEYLYSDSDVHSDTVLKEIKEQYSRYCSTKRGAALFLSMMINMMQSLRGEIYQKFVLLYQHLELEKSIEKRLKSRSRTTVLAVLYEIGMFQLDRYRSLVEKLYNTGEDEIKYEVLQTFFMLQGEQALPLLYRYERELSQWQQLELVQTIKEHLVKERLELKSMFTSNNNSLVDLAGKLVKIYPEYQLSEIQ